MFAGRQGKGECFAGAGHIVAFFPGVGELIIIRIAGTGAIQGDLCAFKWSAVDGLVIASIGNRRITTSSIASITIAGILYGFCLRIIIRVWRILRIIEVTNKNHVRRGVSDECGISYKVVGKILTQAIAVNEYGSTVTGDIVEFKHIIVVSGLAYSPIVRTVLAMAHSSPTGVL